MKTIQRALAASAGLLLLVPLSACFPNQILDAVADTKPSENPAPAPNQESATPPVSVETTCNQLLGIGSDKNPLAAAAALVTEVATSESLEGVTEEEITELATSLEGIARHAPPEIKPYIEMAAAPIVDFRDVKSGAKPSLTFDTTDFKAAAEELRTQCTNALL